MRRVLIDKRILDGFKRRARKVYPLEVMEIVVGEIRGEDTVVLSFQAVDHIASEGEIAVDDEDFLNTEQERYRHDVLGTIHSHPNDTVEPSLRDKRSAKKDGEVIYGICAITRSPAGRRYVSWGFWDGKTHKQLELVISE